jgi:hypothetical protein
MIANRSTTRCSTRPTGGRILVAARRRDGRIVVEVRDSGIGIAPEHQSAIFAEFYQVGNAAREQGKGLGLGLSIVDRLAKALHIEIGLRSRVGEGTTFTLSLPAAQPQAAVEPVGTAERLHVLGDSEALLACIEWPPTGATRSARTTGCRRWRRRRACWSSPTPTAPRRWPSACRPTHR